MQCTPHELKEKLLKGLDEENNVVDMATVVAVISILEKYPMSREVLEQTRIGRHVNEMRKKTKDEQLAKRAKKLVKNWQTLISSANPLVNGDNGEKVIHPSVAGIKSNSNSPALGSLSPALHSVKSSQQCKRLPGSKPNTPSLPSLKPNTPTLQQINKPNTPYQSAIKSKPNTPVMPRNIVSPSISSVPSSSPKLHSTPKILNSPRMTLANNVPCPSPAVSPVSSGSRPSTPVDTPIRPPSSTQTDSSYCRLTRNRSRESLSSTYSDKLPPDSQHSFDMNGKSTSRNCDEKLSKTNIANRKRARLDYSGELENKTAKTDISMNSKVNGAVKTGSNSNTQKTNGTLSRSPSESSLNKSFPCRKNVSLSINTDLPVDKSSKTPKVKTTAQLIAELQAKSGSSSVGSDVIKQIETNQIIKESDVPESVLPPGARPRRNKKRGLDPSLLDMATPNRMHANLSQTKSELVEKFLETSITPSTAMDMTPFKCDDRSESLESGRGEGSSIEVVDSSGGDHGYRLDEVKSQEQTEQGSNNVKIPSLEEIMNNLPPIDFDNVLEDDNDFDIPDRGSVTDDIIDKLHNDEWTSVNGNHDSNGVWYDWTQMFTNLSYSEEPLHILPYVLIDD